MKTPITSGTFVALAVSAVLGYAAPRQAKPAPPHTPARPTTITLTGCLEQGSSARTPVLVPDSEAGDDTHAQRERTVETIKQTSSGC